MYRIGLISDTHGLLRPQALEFLRGCDQIIHAGDVGKPQILQALSALAPVTVVRGNNDQGAWAEALAHSRTLRFGDVLLHLVHGLAELTIDPAAHGVCVVVSGHSHRPKVVEQGGVLYVNPGSAGPRRFKLPISVGELVIDGSHVASRLVELH